MEHAAGPASGGGADEGPGPGLGRRPGHETVRLRRARTAPCARAARVMLVDDEGAILRLYSIVLARAGFEVVATATDGRSAVELRRAARPDVILMDHRMPVMDGLEASRAIIGEEPGARIVLVSADESAEEEAMEAGALLFLRKPAGLEAIIEALRCALGAGR